MAEMVVKRLLEHLERARFVVMKRPPGVGERRSLGASRVRERKAAELPGLSGSTISPALIGQVAARHPPSAGAPFWHVYHGRFTCVFMPIDATLL
jgi:hypothetical protein